MAAPKTRSRLAATLVVLAALTPSACGPPRREHRPAASLLSGTRAPLSPPQLERAAATARRFARAYARSIYREQPPALPGAADRVTSALRAAAARVPPARRHLNPRAGPLVLEPESPTRAAAQITILDGRSPPFSVGFGLTRHGARWLITSISPPG